MKYTYPDNNAHKTTLLLPNKEQKIHPNLPAKQKASPMVTSNSSSFFPNQNINFKKHLSSNPSSSIKHPMVISEANNVLIGSKETYPKHPKTLKLVSYTTTFKSKVYISPHKLSKNPPIDLGIKPNKYSLINISLRKYHYVSLRYEYRERKDLVSKIDLQPVNDRGAPHSQPKSLHSENILIISN